MESDSIQDLITELNWTTRYPASVQGNGPLTNRQLFLRFAIDYATANGRQGPVNTLEEGGVLWAQVGRNSTCEFFLGFDPDLDTLYKRSTDEEEWFSESKVYPVDGQNLGYVGHW